MALSETIRGAANEAGVGTTQIKIDKEYVQDGVPSVAVDIDYRVQGVMYRGHWSFARKNHMTDEHIAAVVVSYMRTGRTQ